MRRHLWTLALLLALARPCRASPVSGLCVALRCEDGALLLSDARHYLPAAGVAQRHSDLGGDLSSAHVRVVRESGAVLAAAGRLADAETLFDEFRAAWSRAAVATDASDFLAPPLSEGDRGAAAPVVVRRGQDGSPVASSAVPPTATNFLFFCAENLHHVRRMQHRRQPLRLTAVAVGRDRAGAPLAGLVDGRGMMLLPREGICAAGPGADEVLAFLRSRFDPERTSVADARELLLQCVADRFANNRSGQLAAEDARFYLAEVGAAGAPAERIVGVGAGARAGALGEP